jgi:HYR domain/Immunoglobulin domain/FIMAH domain
MNRFTAGFSARVSASVLLVALVVLGFNAVVESRSKNSRSADLPNASSLGKSSSSSYEIVTGTNDSARERALGAAPAIIPPAATFTVDTTADFPILSACTAAPLDCSLRGAIIAANSNPGSTIIVPAGTYLLTIAGAGEQFAATGDLDVRASGTSIVGAGAATTIIQQTTGDRVFELNPVPQLSGFTFSISGVTIKDGSTTGSGGGILGGGPVSSTTITDCVFDNDRVTGTLASNGGAISITSTVAADLTITGTTFTNNTTATGIGGAIRYSSLGGTLTITGSTFSGNKANTNSGGAINATGPGTGGTYNIGKSSFVNNQALGSASRGGAIQLVSGTLNVSFSRLVGNISGSGIGSAIANSGSTGTETLDNNWWGVNTGPAGGDVFGTTVISWLQLRHSASPNAICTNASSTLTADIFGLNTGGTTAPSNLAGLPAFPVPPGTIFNNASLGTLSGASTQFIDGSATATFTAGATPGSGGADAIADNQTINASITVQEATTTSNPGDQTVCQGATASFSTTASGAGPFHYVWTLDGSPFDGDNSSISVPTGSLSVGPHTVSVTTTGACGSASQSATLTVKQNTSTTKPNDQTVCAGSTASFSTTASGTGPFTFVWKKGSTVLHTGDLGGRVTITSTSTTSSLTISNVQSTDAGTYSVETTGACGTATQSATLALDSTPPTITCPSNITVQPTCPSGAVVTYTAPVGVDNCPGAMTTRTAGLASGSVFPIGTTTVTYTVTDTSGNSASCSFTVTVKTPAAAIQDLINSVQALINQGVLNQSNGQGLINKLQAALNDLNSGNTARACDDLDSFIDKVQGYIQHGTLTSAQGQPLIDSARHIKNTLGCNGTSGTCT